MALDTSEIKAYSRALRVAAPAHIAAVAQSAQTVMGKVAEEARQRAPSDRPWLSTSDGIRTDHSVRGGTVRASVYSPRDPEGRNVGLHVEYGTADTTPQPFMTPPYERGRAQFISDIGRIIGRI